MHHLSKPGYSLLIEYQPATGQHPFFLQYTTSHAHHTFKGSSQQSPWCIQILPKGYRIYSNILRLHLHVSMQEISNYSFELTTNSMKPESFRAWQSSFLNGIQDLELTASEELDLLVLSSVYFLTPKLGHRSSSLSESHHYRWQRQDGFVLRRAKLAPKLFLYPSHWTLWGSAGCRNGRTYPRGACP